MDLSSEKVPHISYKVVVQDMFDAQAAHKPWSLIRLGDGESAILGYPHFGHSLRYRLWMQNFFGPHAGPEESYVRLRADIEDAIRGADVVGTGANIITDIDAGQAVLMDLGARPREERVEAENLLLNKAERIFLQHHVAALGPIRGVLTSANVHTYMEKTGALAKLIQRAKSVTLIGCRDLSAVFARRFADKPLRHMTIPGEYKWETPQSQAEWLARTPHFPDVYDRLCRTLGAGDFDDVVLVGAGPCGKVYCEAVRAAGGFAVDIGSIMDMWADVVTRSYMREIDRATFPA